MKAAVQLELRRVDAVAYQVLRDATRQLEFTPQQRVPTSRNESVLSSHIFFSWLNERNAHQETACYRAQREALSSKYAVRSTKG